MTRTQREEDFVTKATMFIFGAIGVCIALPIIGIVAGLSWRLCKAIAGA